MTSGMTVRVQISQGVVIKVILAVIVLVVYHLGLSL
jgi:hypothetical protein